MITVLAILFMAVSLVVIFVMFRKHDEKFIRSLEGLFQEREKVFRELLERLKDSNGRNY